jgi:hypothetical protein
VIKPSRRAVVLAASFALGLSCVAPAAHAGLLGGGDSSVEGLPLPVGGDLLGGLLEGDLLGSVLGGDLLGGDLLGGDLLGGVLGGGLPLDLLGGGVAGQALPLDLLGGGLPLDLLGGGLPLDVLGEDGPLGLVGGVLGGEDGGLLAGEGIVELVPDLGIVPGLGSVSEILEAFSDSGSLVPGLQVLDEFGILGILGSM